MRGLRHWGRWLALCAAVGGLGGCSFAGIGTTTPLAARNVSVFRLAPGMCFNPPTKVQAQLTDLRIVSCRTPHTEQVYYTAGTYPAGKGAAYPGATKLERKADGVCVQHFAAYVGTSYQHSSLFYTYLLPTVRAWTTTGDRQLVCVLTTTGRTYTRSWKGSRA